MSADVTVPVVTDRYSLLGYPSDLAGYRRALGPIPIPSVVDGNWSQGLIEAIEASGLTGRGGASFPTSIKLASASRAKSNTLIVVNAMEGEPASDKDKVLLTRAPHHVLDGAQLLAAATGASRVVVCVPIGRDAIAGALAHAIAERVAVGHSRVREEVLRPPDRFVAGEESALTMWLHTGESLPQFRPDKSRQLTIGRQPVLVHNAETLAHVAMIARLGPGAFSARGLREEPGTTLVTISGSVAQPGVVETERGAPLIEIVQRAAPIESLQALLVGGYGGTWVGPEHFSMPYASFALRTIGAVAGPGIIVALRTSACGIAESARVAHYAAGQSAGQCGPCVYGLPAIADDLARVASGQCDPDVAHRLGRRFDQVNGRGACRHPDGTVAMARSALEVFADDLAAHLSGRPCAHWRNHTQLRFPYPSEV